MYKITETKVEIEGQEHITHGICCDGVCINDISTDKVAVEHLIDRLNKYDLAPIQLYDVIDDFIA